MHLIKLSFLETMLALLEESTSQRFVRMKKLTAKYFSFSIAVGEKSAQYITPTASVILLP